MTSDDAVLRVEKFRIASSDDTIATPEGLLATSPAWIAAAPGGVVESLIAAGEIPHPFVSDHEARVRWVEDRVWWYRAPVELPSTEQPWELTIEGLDTVGDVWLGSRYLGHHESQFVPMRVTIPGDPECRRSDLFIRIPPPLLGLDEPQHVRGMVDAVAAFLADAGPGEGTPEQASGILTLNLAATRRRKALFSWGWDFAPRVVSVGLAGPVTIARTRPVRIVGCGLRTLTLDLDERVARVEARAGLEASSGTKIDRVEFSLQSPSGERLEMAATLTEDGATATATVFDVHPWWTHDLGDPALYTLCVRVHTGGEVLEQSRRVGIRTIELDQSPDLDDPEVNEPAQHFRFILNGVPLFARGANLVPGSMLPGSVTPSYYRRLVRLAADANMTMIRVWGGGIYASEAFMDACDEAGILVWHDFMFACIDYPADDESLMRAVTEEATEVTRRMAHHPSLALWAGNNEVLAMHQAVFGDLTPGSWGDHIFWTLLPTAVAANSPGTVYWPGSPWTDASVDPRANGTRSGDRHAWEVWHGADVGAGTHEAYSSIGAAMHFHRYRYDTGRFISEFGLHASADLSTLERWVGPEHMTMADPVMLARNKDVPATKGRELIAAEAGEPTDLRSLVTFSQLVQAEGLKFGIEHYRRREPHCSGALVWQLNEPWPGMTWSLVDFDLGAKPGYHAARRAFTPVLASFEDDGNGELRLWISNSTPEDIEGRAHIAVRAFDGKTPLEWSAEFCVPSHTSQPVWSASVPARYRDGAHLIWVDSPSGAFASNRMFFTPVKELALPSPGLTYQVLAAGETEALVNVRSERFAYFVRVLTPWGGVVASDNAFDLETGATRTVRLSGLPRGYAPSAIEVRDFVADRGAPGEAHE